MIQMCIAPTKNFITHSMEGLFVHSFIHSFILILFTISHIITIKLRKLTKQMARKPERNNRAYKKSGFLRTKKMSLI